MKQNAAHAERDEALDIVYSTATDLAAAIRAGKLSATEVLEAHLAQIEKHNATLNSVVTLDAEGARERAREADAVLARGEIWGPLHGVPFTVKDAHCVAGMRTTVGFPPFADYVPEQDSTVVARLKKAGAILIGRSNVPTLLSDFQSSNPLFGRTSNPWNPAMTSGGSSGGAAAALAAGMTPFEIGTDLSASIRLPASFCGVFGLKPTEQRVSLAGGFPNPGNVPASIRIMSSIGPMARSVEDLALLFGIIAGPDGEDTEVKPVPFDPVPEPALKDLRVAFAPTFPDFPVAASVRSAVTDLATRLERAGAVVEEAALPKLDLHADLQSLGSLIGMMIGAFQPDGGEPPATLAQYLSALDRRDISIRKWEAFFDSCDVLLCPTGMVTAFPHCEPGTPLKVDGEDASYWMVSAHSAVFNYSGHPAVTLPCGLDGSGLPLGVQIVGKRWHELRLLAVAKAISRISGEFRRPPGY